MNHKRNYIIVVTGLPRSGTSMMMKMLEAGGLTTLVDHVRQADEDNPRGYYEFEPVKNTRDDPSWLKNATGKVVKMVYRLLYDLPPDYQYRAIFMNRKLPEIFASQQAMLKRNNENITDITPEEFESLFQTEINNTKSWLEQQPNISCIDVHYNHILHDPLPHIQTICNFLDGQLDLDAMKQVVEPALYRNRHIASS